jgi:hypothetical protein
MSLYMVFDVESVGLHGEGFAVGLVVIDESGAVNSWEVFACDPAEASGDDEGRRWVAENVKLSRGYNCRDPRHVRGRFWDAWLFGKSQGAVMVADCCWPVEARFLSACIDDDPAARYWLGPYPLHDLASIRLAVGLDPLGTNDRLPDEQPAHDPLADARQSARLLIEALACRS